MFDSLKYQVGSDHYKGLSIEPAQYIIKNNLLFPEGNVIKYTTRHDYWKRKKIPTKDLPKIKSKGKKSRPWRVSFSFSVGLLSLPPPPTPPPPPGSSRDF